MIFSMAHYSISKIGKLYLMFAGATAAKRAYDAMRNHHEHLEERVTPPPPPVVNPEQIDPERRKKLLEMYNNIVSSNDYKIWEEFGYSFEEYLETLDESKYERITGGKKMPRF